jgi:hypothetical protein
LGGISFEPFADKVPQSTENFHALSTGEDLVFRALAFTELFQDLCARMMTSCMMTLEVSPLPEDS